MLLITDEIARRLETAEALDAAGCAEAQCRLDRSLGASVRAVGGGVAVFCGVDSPLTHCLGLGVHGPLTEEDLDNVEAFFEDRGAAVSIDVCPHADASLCELLRLRPYRPSEFVNVMVREPSQLEANTHTGLNVHVAEPQEHGVYVETVIGGFFGRSTLTEEEVRLGTTLFHMPCSSAFLASLDGHIAGGGGMSIRNRVACLFGDATLPDYRNRGVHTALIQCRTSYASQQQCDLITAGTHPGSASQRNYQRLGFQVAYTKVTMVKV